MSEPACAVLLRGTGNLVGRIMAEALLKRDSQRISLFAALPIPSLDRLTVKSRLDEICRNR